MIHLHTYIGYYYYRRAMETKDHVLSINDRKSITRLSAVRLLHFKLNHADNVF